MLKRAEIFSLQKRGRILISKCKRIKYLEVVQLHSYKSNQRLTVISIYNASKKGEKRKKKLQKEFFFSMMSMQIISTHIFKKNKKLAMQ